MMKLSRLGLIGFVAVSALVGCSSSEKKEEDSSAPAAVTSESPAQVTVKPVAGNVKAGNPLNDAIKSQSDEVIYKASTDSLAQNPNDTKALNALALYHLRKGKAVAAQFLLNKAITLSSQNSAFHNNLGSAFLAQQKEKEAIREFKKALELNAKNPDAAGNLGSLYLHHRDFKRAFVILDMGFKTSPQDSKWLNNYAVAAAASGHSDIASSTYQKAMQVAPANKEILFNYATFKIEYLHKSRDGLDLLDRIKVMGVPESMKNALNVLEIHAKAGLK